jgi:mono/diheme cytochrome c family protein
MNRSFLGILLILLAGISTLRASSSSPSAAQASSAYTAANAGAGQQVFLQKCFQCHSVNQGETRIGPSLFHVMKGGHAKTAAEIRVQLRDGKGKMPPFKDLLTPQDVDHVIAYLHTL